MNYDRKQTCSMLRSSQLEALIFNRGRVIGLQVHVMASNIWFLTEINLVIATTGLGDKKSKSSSSLV